MPCEGCGHERHAVLKQRAVLQCNRCKRQVSLTAGTIFHSTKLPLTTWFLAIYHLAQSKGGIGECDMLNDEMAPGLRLVELVSIALPGGIFIAGRPRCLCSVARDFRPADLLQNARAMPVARSEPQRRCPKVRFAPDRALCPARPFSKKHSGP